MSEPVLNFAWNTQKVRTKGLSPVDNRVIIVETTPIEIVRAPNRHSVESIIAAMCVTLTELVAVQEAAARRVIDLQKRMQEAATAPPPTKEKRDEPPRDKYDNPDLMPKPKRKAKRRTA